MGVGIWKTGLVVENSGACKSGSIWVGGLWSFLPFLLSSSPTSFFPVHLSLFLLSPHPSPKRRVSLIRLLNNH